MLVWLSPLVIAMGFDVISRGRVHIVNLGSLTVLAVAFVRTFYQDSEAWLTVGRPLLALFL